jgi:hypothetical protein
LLFLFAIPPTITTTKMKENKSKYFHPIWRAWIKKSSKKTKRNMRKKERVLRNEHLSDGSSHQPCDAITVVGPGGKHNHRVCITHLPSR